nr:integrase, catalytic region, zinc finger, CCHC-type, peptidase aspartic, catalytic [Tanacetum cinerariifolium]
IINKELIECNHPTFFDNNEDHSVQNKEYCSNEIAALNSNQEKEGPPQDSDIRQLIREECCIEVCEEQKQNMENTILELVEIYLDTLSSVRRPKLSGVMWMKKGSFNTVKADFAFDCNNVRNALCNARINASVDVNDLFVFNDIIQICLWIIDSGCSKHMTGNRALLTNFVEKFLGIVRFGNNDFAMIAGNGDVVIGSMTIKKVYYVKGH